MSEVMHKALANAAASNRMEGYQISRQQVADAKKILEGKLRLEDCLAKIQQRAAQK